MGTDLNRRALWAAAAPLSLAVAIAAMLLAALLGAHPMWETPTLNMSEAAAARDVATVALLLERGEDPKERRLIAAPFLEDAGSELTPLEAAVSAGRLEVVHLLMARGTAVDTAARVRLACRAAERGYADVAAYFDRPASADCPR